MSGPGRFIVLEGAEGVGKTTQAHRLSEWLSQIGVPHRLAREPGGTPVGEAIRNVLLDSPDLRIEPETELLLMLAARAAFVREVVRPTLSRGETMISDRFELSTLVYQGLGRGLGLSRTRSLNEFATGGLRPDLTVVLDVPVELGRARQSAGGKTRDRIEGEGDEFFERVRSAYRELSEGDDSIRLVDARPSETEVHESIRALLASRFPELFGQARG